MINKPIKYLEKQDIVELGTGVYDLILKSFAIVLQTKIVEYSSCFIEKHELFYLKDETYKYIHLVDEKTNFKFFKNCMEK